MPGLVMVFRGCIRAFICVLAAISIAGCSSSAQDAVSQHQPPTRSVPTFDGKRAFELLKKQVEIGPRYPGAPGHSQASKFIQAQLKPYVDSISVQEFSRKVSGKTLEMENIIARFNSKSGKWVLLAAHWDTRPTADMEVAAERKVKPIPGANDGASGVAVLLELARIFSEHRPDVGVMMVFFDGEDYGSTRDDMCMGSAHFAENLKQSTQVDGKPANVAYGILLDMIGDRNLNIHPEARSVKSAPEIVDKVWETAERLGYGQQFPPSEKYSVFDDHVPLIDAGLKCIDVIDFDYAPWHTLDDTPDKCSAESLKIVGEVVADVIYEERP